MSPLLEIHDLAKRFPARNGRDEPPWVIQGLSFVVHEGEFLTIIGPSGAGKTTLLNMIAQIDSANGGEIRFQSERAPVGDPTALNPGLACRIGYVTQEDNLLPWRTTLQNVLFPLTVQGRLNDETRARADMLIRAAGLAGFENHFPHELSGGMRKRTALIRTLVYDPPVILMDEPFGALDAQTRTAMQDLLLEVLQTEGKTVLLITHSVDEAIYLSSRIVVVTARPAKVRVVIDVPFPYPRREAVHEDPRFAALRARIRDLVMQEYAAQAKQARPLD